MAETIIQEPHPVLRAVAPHVPVSEIRSEKIQSILKRMSDSLAGEGDGVAIAAPQIGESLRIFVVSKKVLKGAEKDLAFINPEIVRLGTGKEDMSEGCLSCRWKYGLVKRSKTATVKALNAEGNEFVMSGRSLIAQIFQHEIDHLDGILFIDKARNVKDMPPEEK